MKRKSSTQFLHVLLKLKQLKMSPTSKKQEETSTKFAKKSEADSKKYSTNISERILGKKLHDQ